MPEKLHLRSVSFDTSFLLKDNTLVDKVIDALAHDHISCFVTSTVASELEQLKVWGRIPASTHKKAMKRLTHTHATVIDFKNRLLSDALGRACMRTMEEHGVPASHVKNDCAILVSALKNGVDLFLSEDFHFTSAITKEVIKEVKSAACAEYQLMCQTRLYSVDTRTFLEAYEKGTIDVEVIQRESLRREHMRNR